MSIGRELLSEILTKAVADSAETREEGAELAADFADSLSLLEAKVITRVLASISTFEDSMRAREGQLHAVLEIVDPDNATIDDVAPCLRIDKKTLSVPEVDYIDGLTKMFRADEPSTQRMLTEKPLWEDFC